MPTAKKVKTSVSLSEDTIEKLRIIAAADDRSVSYIIEKFAEKLVAQEETKKFGTSTPSPDAVPPGDGGAYHPEVQPAMKYPKPARRKTK